MASEKFKILLEKLLEKTCGRELQWHETADESAFRIALGNGLVRIEFDSDYENDTYYAAYLQNKQGRTLDQIGPLYSQHTLRDFLSEIFVAARISALGVDELLEGMEEDLKSGKTQPLPPEDEDDDLPF